MNAAVFDFRKMAIDEMLRLEPKGGLDQTVYEAFSVFDNLCVDDGNRLHGERVGLTALEVARHLKQNERSQVLLLCGGFLHDVGKIRYADRYFNGQDYGRSAYEEFRKVKEKHPLDGYDILIKRHLCMALIAGGHHGVYDGGYGLSLRDLRSIWRDYTGSRLNCETEDMLVETLYIIAICDFIDSHYYKPRSYDGRYGEEDMWHRIEERFPQKLHIAETAISVGRKYLQKGLTM